MGHDAAKLRRAIYADLEAVPTGKVAELEIYVLGEEAHWSEPRRYQGAEQVRAEPFDAIALDLRLLWAR